ncbi:MAG: hypothetical protein ABI053_06615, partial [Lacisediminihabitans sp.]
YTVEKPGSDFDYGYVNERLTMYIPDSILLHVADLDNATSTTSGSSWQPKVTVTVVDSADVPVQGATVSGYLANQYINAVCTTGADGTCTIVNSLDASVTSTQFWVANIVKGTSAYVQTANTDPDGDSNGTSITITRGSSPTSASAHIGDLDNTTTRVSGTKWYPKATATVLDANGVAVAGATVSGKFTHHSGTVTCVTAANGVCTVGNFSLGRSTTSTAFTVTSVVKTNTTYESTANTDPDGDSSGTTININRP